MNVAIGNPPSPEEKLEKGDFRKRFHVIFLKYKELVVFMILKNQMKKKRCQIISNLHH